MKRKLGIARCELACCAGRHRFATCADCAELPCAVWQGSRDPSITDEAFRTSIESRVSTLKSAAGV